MVDGEQEDQREERGVKEETKECYVSINQDLNLRIVNWRGPGPPVCIIKKVLIWIGKMAGRK